MKQLVCLFVGFAIIRLAFAGTVETDLTGTTSSPVSGWEYNVGSEYADGSLKLDKTGSTVTSEIYPGAVTSLTVRIKGNSTSGGNTVLELYGSTDGITFSEAPLEQIVPTSAIADHVTVLDAAQSFIRFKWVMVKDKGNIGLYAVTAETDDTPILLPPPPPDGLSVSDRTSNGFTLRWNGSETVTNYCVVVTCLTGTAARVEATGFEGYPNTTVIGWSITNDAKDSIYDSATYSGISPPAVKLKETGHQVETRYMEAPVETFAFWAKATGAGSSLRIEAFDGTAWNEIDTYSVGTGAAEQRYTFEESDNYFVFRLTLEKTLSGNVALDDVILTTFSALAPSNVVDHVSTGTETVFRLDELPEGTYTCHIIAQNEAGDSLPSTPLQVVIGEEELPNPENKPLAAIPLTENEGTYTQNFDALETSANNVWTNGIMPLAGWYAFADSEACVSYRGGGSGGGLWSLPDPEEGQALGSQGANGQTYRYGLSFTNETEKTITSVEIAFTVAQRYIGKSEVANLLLFSYRISTNASPLFEGSWLRVPELCFLTPAYGNGLSGATNEVQFLSATPQLSLPPGEVLSLRWTDVDDPGTDHRFAIDDFSFSWRTDSSSPTALSIPLSGREETFDSVLAEPDAGLPPFWRTGTETLSVDRILEERVAGRYSQTAKGGLYSFCGNLSLDTTLFAWLTPECPNVYLLGVFSNGSPQNIQRWETRYTLKKMGSGTVPVRVTLWVSRDGIIWSACGTAGFAADESDSPPVWNDSPQAEQTVTEMVHLDRALIPGERFYLAWSFSTEVPLTTPAAQVVGVDDFSIIPVFPQGTVLLLE